MKRGKPSIRALRPAECRGLLRRNSVGRIAFTFRDRVDIEPINYVFDGVWLYARTSIGTKLRQLRHHPWVAFEVDEIAGPHDWRSVVAHGAVYFVTNTTTPSEERMRAVRLLRKLDPDALTEDDATPHRSLVFRIHVGELTGRAAVSKTATAKRGTAD